jgi:hypothetical protein
LDDEVELREVLELRVWEDRAHLLFGEDEGKRSGLVRRLFLPLKDPRLARLAELHQATDGCGRGDPIVCQAPGKAAGIILERVSHSIQI